ncbi:hypothetical protein [Anaeromusa sp.]|uniref:hypothetical protein n=1 Tax=Anaeromusa sp. TaxID=1872520 RepID=UPI002636E60F|nr:hypothetical protein [Anaeromusa sp.]MDD3158063.1 hypothetical protein [Anaeromusa sp.]
MVILERLFAAWENVAFGDMASVKVPIPAATVQALQDGYIQVWLIPAGQEPFPWIREEAFVQAFLQNYRLEERTTHFDVWTYKPKM